MHALKAGCKDRIFLVAREIRALHAKFLKRNQNRPERRPVRCTFGIKRQCVVFERIRFAGESEKKTSERRGKLADHKINARNQAHEDGKQHATRTGIKIGVCGLRFEQDTQNNERNGKRASHGRYREARLASAVPEAKSAAARTANAQTKIKHDMAAPSLIKPLSIMSMAATAATMLEGV